MKFDGNDTIKVCIGNYGYYNEGELRDKWIELPKTNEEIDRFLADNGLRDATHEEIYISDYDDYPFGIKSSSMFTEYTGLDNLNLLAMQIQNDPDAAERVSAALDCGCDVPDDICGLMNWIAQADEIPFYTYDYQHMGNPNEFGIPWDSDLTPEEKLGYTLAEMNEQLAQLLESSSAIECAFDYGKYGEAMAYDLNLGDAGYIDGTQDMPDQGFYDRDELREMISETWQRDREAVASQAAEARTPQAIPIPDQRTQACRHANIDGDARTAGAAQQADRSQSIEAKSKGATR